LITEGVAGNDAYHLSPQLVEDVVENISSTPGEVNEFSKTIDWVYNGSLFRKR
jgi:hypothetical protein